MEKAKRGRPQQNDSGVMDALLKNEATQKKFKAQLENLVFHKRAMILEAESYAEDVSAVAEDTQLSKGFINKLVNSLAKDKQMDLAKEGTMFAEVVETMFANEQDES